MNPRSLSFLILPGLFLVACNGGGEEIPGCMDFPAINYNPQATVPDESCIYAGCMDPEAFNYFELATVDLDNCLYEGCTDPEALNYDPEADVDDGSCEYEPNPTSCEDDVLYDGHFYSVVEIGEQCWFAENLQTTVFSSGLAIEEVTDNDEWGNLSTPAQCVYVNEILNLPVYGRMYNGYAVTSEEGLCPEGWHVPSNADWEELELFLGVPEEEIDVLSEWRGSDEGVGTAMKATLGWNQGGNGTDLYGFNAVPGGIRSYVTGEFVAAGDNGTWWSSSIQEEDVKQRSLYFQFDGILTAFTHSQFGASVRCIRN